jgi:hypothetical protein
MIRNKALTCDHPGCPREIVGPPGGQARTLRGRAAKQGWTRTEAGRDLCPDHSTPQPSPGPPEGLSEDSRRLLGLTGPVPEIQRAALEAAERLAARGAAATPRGVADELGQFGPGAGYQRVRVAIAVLRSLGRWPYNPPGAAR